MREWAKLTPEQRRVVRENYTSTKKVDPNQKSEKWQRYQELSEEQKKKLAEDAAAKKRLTNLPTPAQNQAKLGPSLKAVTRPSASAKASASAAASAKPASAKAAPTATSPAPVSATPAPTPTPVVAGSPAASPTTPPASTPPVSTSPAK